MAHSSSPSWWQTSYDHAGLLKVITSVLYPPGNMRQLIFQTTCCVAHAFIAAWSFLGDEGDELDGWWSPCAVQCVETNWKIRETHPFPYQYMGSVHTCKHAPPAYKRIRTNGELESTKRYLDGFQVLVTWVWHYLSQGMAGKGMAALLAPFSPTCAVALLGEPFVVFSYWSVLLPFPSWGTFCLHLSSIFWSYAIFP